MGKLTHIGDDSTYNLRFIKCIENNPCLWNNRKSDYSNRDIVESAWESIAEEMNDIVPNCRERWRNIRTAFTRSLKGKKSYYLSKKLQFLLPHIRRVTDIKGNPVEDNDDDESIKENVDNPCSSSLKNEKNDTDDDETSTQQDFEKNDQTGVKKLISDPLYTERSFKRKYNEFSSTNTTLPVQWIDSERNKSANEHFLLSLVPFMDEMTGKQNRAFRMKVMKLIDDVLDGNDSQ